ncbi:MAG: hypothetical protein ACRCYY_03650 [Trueperaceae bacterium]
MKLRHGQNFIIYMPVIFLVLVACTHLVLFYFHDASPWHGGGFGMFAVIDGIFTRDVEVEVVTNGKREKIDLLDYSARVDDIVTLPTIAVLAGFAEEVACDLNVKKGDGGSHLNLYYYKKVFILEGLRLRRYLYQSIEEVVCG